jgi:glycosyltransferase involved in cell wall biosynthesis
MKIAIDVHSLGTQAGGNETYYRQLLSGLADDKSSHQYNLFYTHAGAPVQTQSDPRFHFERIPHNPIVRICGVLPRRLKKIRPDVFHCQYIMPPFVKVPTVVTIHDLAHEHHPDFFHPLEARKMKTLVRWTASRADHILTVSEFSANDIARRFNVPREKITVAYLAASPEFQPRDKSRSQEQIAKSYGIDAPFILYVGRIQARKNLLRLVDAYHRVRQEGITSKLVIVGKQDWQSEQLLEKIKTLGLESSVIFPGYVPFHDLPPFYNAAELFVFPSIFEGFGLPVIESMASGVPTITSFGSSLEEVAGNGALLVDPLDTDAITQALGKALTDMPLRQQLVTQGLRRSAQFKPDMLAQKALEVYRSLG